MKYKKLLVSLGTVITTTFPVVSIIACSPEAENHGNQKHTHGDFDEALIKKLPAKVEISGIDSSSDDNVIKEKIKEALNAEKEKDSYKDVKEDLEHLLEHDYATAVLDKDAKTLTIDAHGVDYVVTYTIK